MRFILFVIASLFAVSCQEMADKPREQVMKGTPLVIAPKDAYEGTYTIADDSLGDNSPCAIHLVISHNKKGYGYHLITDKRDLKGVANFKKQTEGTLLTLEGITWDDYEGDISNDNEPTEDIEIPVSVGANIKNDTITLQNYGNAMNSYTIFGECGRKYIVLVKQ